MKENRIRKMLSEGRCTTATRYWCPWPFFIEAAGAAGNFDYVEVCAEYAALSQEDLENIARAAEIYEMGTMLKVDFANRIYVAQKAVASGFQGINFADHRTPEQVEETVQALRAMTDKGGSYGYLNRRFISTPLGTDQKGHIERLENIVCCFMIEKTEAFDNLEAICQIPGVDMVQFGPSDWSMNHGWNKAEHKQECREAEEYMIRTALKYGVQPRCEISTPEEAEYYIGLGVRHFNMGDQLKILTAFLKDQGSVLRKRADELDRAR